MGEQGLVQRVFPSTVRCRTCQDRAGLTNWLPPKGYDPNIREYHCPYCGKETYRRGIPKQEAQLLTKSTGLPFTAP